MKNKLHALIEEQKALTAKFEELLNETDAKPYAFIGHSLRGKEIGEYFGVRDKNLSGSDAIYWWCYAKQIIDSAYRDTVYWRLIHNTHTVIDLNEQPDFFEELSNSEIPNNLDLKRVYIKGHPTRGAEVIKMLEDLGGVNKFNWDGTRSWIIYRIRHEDNVILSTAIEDLRYTPCNIELHLPEEVSAENAQTTDIKAGDWIQFTKVCEKIGKRQTNYLLTNIVDVKEVCDRGISVCIPNIGKTYHKFKCSSFHKVDPPKEEVELIEGEVYVNKYGTVFIFHQVNRFGGVDIYAGLNLSGRLFYCKSINTNNLSVATPEQRKQLFDALKKSGKHFDKENMRLLDVEEFSLKDGDPFICKMNGKLSVEVFAYYEEPFGVVSYNNYTCTPLMPFTHETKHLIGTTHSPDKHYKFVSK